MEVTILNHFINDGREYGEYYVSHNNVKHLVVQNEDDYKAIPHLYKHKVSECISSVRKEVIDAIKDKLREVEE